MIDAQSVKSCSWRNNEQRDRALHHPVCSVSVALVLAHWGIGMTNVQPLVMYTDRQIAPLAALSVRSSEVLEQAEEYLKWLQGNEN
jgi:hypothetical protein